jgi:hypothetical protein
LVSVCNGDFSSIDIAFMQNSGGAMKLIPADATIAELEKKATVCEEKAKQEAEPKATELMEEALLYREWIAALSSGKWHA